MAMGMAQAHAARRASRRAEHLHEPSHRSLKKLGIGAKIPTVTEPIVQPITMRVVPGTAGRKEQGARQSARLRPSDDGPNHHCQATGSKA